MVAWDEFRFGDLDGQRLDQPRMAGAARKHVGTIFQQPSLALDPAFHVGDQIAEVVRRHTPMSRGDAKARAVELMDRVGIINPAERAKQYPHT